MLVTVLLWALNLTMTRYILTHGFEPLAYATVRYGIATAIFVGIVLVGERALRVARADLPLASLAALLIFLNQLCFVFALDRTSASTKAHMGGRESEERLGWETLPSSAPVDEPLPRRR